VIKFYFPIYQLTEKWNRTNMSLFLPTCSVITLKIIIESVIFVAGYLKNMFARIYLKKWDKNKITKMFLTSSDNHSLPSKVCSQESYFLK